MSTPSSTPSSLATTPRPGYDEVKAAAAAIRPQLAETPRCAYVLGSGLGGLAQFVDRAVRIPYAEIPNMPTGKVEGHAGELVAGRLGGLPVVMLSGRAHYYEGFSMAEVVFGVRLCRLLGADSLFLTNAAGGLSSELRPGDLMLIRDHIHLLTGDNPLRGTNDARFGTRFPDMTDLYTRAHRDVMASVARNCGVDLKSGVYVCVPGPSYETPAEVRMLRLLGADAVGMSTTAEAIVAGHAGMAVVGVSCITNAAAGLGGSALNHEEVKEVAGQASSNLQALAVAFAEALAAQRAGGQA